MLALNMYAGDHTEYLPAPCWGTSAPGWAYGANIPTGGTGILSSYLNTLKQQIASFQQGQLAPYLKTEKILMCPADLVDKNFLLRDIYISSYVWNGALCGYGNLSSTTYKITQFDPGAIIQWETDEKTPFFFNDCSSFPDEGVSVRHGKGAAVGVIGGNTQRVIYNNWYNNSMAGAQGARGASIPLNQLPNKLWCNPGDAHGL